MNTLLKILKSETLGWILVAITLFSLLWNAWDQDLIGTGISFGIFLLVLSDHEKDRKKRRERRNGY